MLWLGPNSQAGIVVPRRAAVVPRVRRSRMTAALPLENHIRGMLDADARGLVNVFGPPGSGKSKAVEHLAAILPGEAPIVLLDDGRTRELKSTGQELVIVASQYPILSENLLVAFEMAPWTIDDLVEYLAATHRQRCASVLARAGDRARKGDLDGLPELWAIVADVMAADESIADISAALNWRMGLELAQPADHERAAGLCIRQLLAESAFEQEESIQPRADRLLRHRAVQLPLAAAGIVRQLACGQGSETIARPLPYDLLTEVAKRAAESPQAHLRLRTLAEADEPRLHATSASLLVMMHSDWRPSGKVVPNLTGAYLPDVPWAKVQLPGVHLQNAKLPNAYLVAANLDRAKASSVDLSNARLDCAFLRSANLVDGVLRGASLRSANAAWADFTNADLEDADLTGGNFPNAIFCETVLRGAKLCNANFLGALFQQCNLEEADLRDADFMGTTFNHICLAHAYCNGARFHSACLSDCDLEGLEMANSDFSKAILQNCLLTDSKMPSASFRGAKLQGAGLAGIDWPDADLRDANLTGATFHLGSTRSGLVGSTIPCEGSKTGFYTDEFNHQDYKPPEEIRKANLCGADLRGATIENTDFYLVDLRGARYTEKQREHLTRCGAIVTK